MADFEEAWSPLRAFPAGIVCHGSSGLHYSLFILLGLGWKPIRARLGPGHGKHSA
jgi:hypothetical protein